MIKAFPQPLESVNFYPMAAVVHIAAWRARAEEINYAKEQLVATFPSDVALKIGVTQELIMNDMPPIAELSAGLEDLVS